MLLTFGPLEKSILPKVCKQRGTEFHLVFDKTISPSIKDSVRNKRDNSKHVAYQITGTEQERPSNWFQSLHVDQSKEALVEFLIIFWESNELPFFIGSKRSVKIQETCGFHFAMRTDRWTRELKNSIDATMKEHTPECFYSFQSDQLHQI